MTIEYTIQTLSDGSKKKLLKPGCKTEKGFFFYYYKLIFVVVLQNESINSRLFEGFRYIFYIAYRLVELPFRIIIYWEDFKIFVKDYFKK